MFFAILAAVLDGSPPVSGNLRLAILPVYAATGLHCLTFIVSVCLYALSSPSWAVMTNMESIGDESSDTSSLSMSVSAGSLFVQDSLQLRALHTTTLLLLAFQVLYLCPHHVFVPHFPVQAIFLTSKFDAAFYVGTGGVWTSGWKCVAAPNLSVWKTLLSYTLILEPYQSRGG
jgi:hypothetical protein